MNPEQIDKIMADAAAEADRTFTEDPGSNPFINAINRFEHQAAIQAQRLQDAGATTTDLENWRTNWGTPPRSEKRPHDH